MPWVSPGMGFVHVGPGEEAGAGGERGDHPDRGADAFEVGDDAGEQRADGEPAVAPQPVHTDGAGPPAGMGDVADGGEQGRVDHSGADAEEHRPEKTRPLVGGGAHRGPGQIASAILMPMNAAPRPATMLATTLTAA
jgi:hypothetical protein